MTRDRFTAAIQKREAVKSAEANGQVADSMSVRLAVMQRFDAGEITLEQAQDEIKRIKRNAKKNGQITRAQAFSRG